MSFPIHCSTFLSEFHKELIFRVKKSIVYMAKEIDDKIDKIQAEIDSIQNVKKYKFQYPGLHDFSLLHAS